MPILVGILVWVAYNKPKQPVAIAIPKYQPPAGTCATRPIRTAEKIIVNGTTREEFLAHLKGVYTVLGFKERRMLTLKPNRLLRLAQDEEQQKIEHVRLNDKILGWLGGPEQAEAALQLYMETK